jgi:hypothetical protein
MRQAHHDRLPGTLSSMIIEELRRWDLLFSSCCRYSRLGYSLFCSSGSPATVTSNNARLHRSVWSSMRKCRPTLRRAARANRSSVCSHPAVRPPQAGRARQNIGARDLSVWSLSVSASCTILYAKRSRPAARQDRRSNNQDAVDASDRQPRIAEFGQRAPRGVGG